MVAAGCSINKSENGSGKNVELKTPLGAMHVTTEIDPKDIGIPLYPGARRKADDNDKDQSSANVNISSPLFGVKVLAAKFETDDPPDKVLAFYRDKLKTWGSVVECEGAAGDVSVHTGAGDLDCKGDKHGGSTELKVGTRERQHVVSVKPAGHGSEFALVYVQTRGKNDSM
ncbi:MAG TPA: hypothetical protein VFA60_00955 [Terriglobales bacterium]|nr:hypothetical protein [Terriglobales bacterium]